MASSFVNQLAHDRLWRNRLATVLICLSLVVAGGTAWALHTTGQSKSTQTYCGLEEHVHTADCEQSVLICGYADADGDGVDADGAGGEGVGEGSDGGSGDVSDAGSGDAGTAYSGSTDEKVSGGGVFSSLI